MIKTIESLIIITIPSPPRLSKKIYSMNILIELLDSVKRLSKPSAWSSSLTTITNENNYLKDLISRGNVSIYGVNTRPGHRDNEKLVLIDIEKYQQDLLSSHAIYSGYPCYSDHATRCITFAKLYSFSAGMSGVSPTLFQLLTDLSVDPEFSPQVPRHSSYSSGDVIPAAHWATSVFEELQSRYGYHAQHGEPMAMINGNFIQLGYAASLSQKIRTAWLFFVELSAVSAQITRANPSNLFHAAEPGCPTSRSAIEYLKKQLNNTQKPTQDPVSIRAMPQIIDTLACSVELYLKEIDSCLIKPSGNPLFSLASDTPLSQASFLAPSLTITTGSLIEALLFTMWSILGRTNHLLSGDVDGIPRDASSENSELGLIQYPKYMMSILEKSRMDYGRRIFSSGSSTSYGVEDMWNNGISTLGQLDSLLDDVMSLCSCELYVFKYIKNNHKTRASLNSPLLSSLDEDISLADIESEVKEIISGKIFSGDDHLFPF